jgi:hypothetical protein
VRGPLGGGRGEGGRWEAGWRAESSGGPVGWKS